LRQRNPAITTAQAQILGEICVHSSNAIMLAAFRSRDLEHRQRLTQQIEPLLVSYLEPQMGDQHP
jgi:hypothetical protein